MQYTEGLNGAAGRIAAGITVLALGTANTAEAEGVTLTGEIDCSVGLQVESVAAGVAIVSGRTATMVAQFTAEEMGWSAGAVFEGRSLLTAPVTAEIGQIIFVALSIPVTNAP